MYGVIEGFYGPPWSHVDRLDLLQHHARHGLDAYVYAPKRDPRHRGVRWIEPYDTDELDHFEELVDVGQSLGVTVTFAVAPARVFGRNNISRWGDRDGDGVGDALMGSLLDKLRSLQQRGCRSFAVLFDDTAATFVPALARTSMGRFHARIARRALDELRVADPTASLLIVPAVYNRTWDKLGAAGKAYWRGLSEVPDDVRVAWTGPKIFSPRIEGTDAGRLQDETGLKLVIWNNAIANDFLNLATGEVAGLRGWRKLSFGPVSNLAPDLAGAVDGVLLNGALEPRLTQVSASTLAAWRKAPEAYDPELAHDVALGELGGGDAETAILGRLYDLCRRHVLTAPDRHEAPALFRAARRRDAEAVRAELRGIEALESDAAGVLSEAVGTEAASSLRKAHLVARAILNDDPTARAQARKIRWVVARRPFAEAVRRR